MRILFCGCCLPRKFETRLKDLSVAGNQYQNNLINSLKMYGEVQVLSYVTFPVENLENEIRNESKVEGYTPFIFNKKISKLLEYRKELKSLIDWADCVITYNFMYPWHGIGDIARRRGKKSILVLADYTPSEETKGIIQKIYSLLAKWNFKKYSKVVLLSEGSKNYFDLNQETVLINGCLMKSKFDDFDVKNQGEVIKIVYTGMLSSVAGIELLLESFSLLKGQQYELVICGQGSECEQKIKESCLNDKRIVYKGFLTPEEYKIVLQNADILVNPRDMRFVQNKNNFPSKVLEYLASGRRIVSTRFNGYERYSENIIFSESTPESIAEAIKLASARDVYSTFYTNRKFAEQFLWKQQIQKFL